jgi:hypothetical protein
MATFPLEKIEKILKLNFGRKIYSCGNAKIFELKKYSARVIKIVLMTDDFDDYHEQNYVKLKSIIAWAKKNNNPSVAKVFKFGKFKLGGNEYYYYVMEKLEKLPSKLYSDDFIDLMLVVYVDGIYKFTEFLEPRIKKFIDGAQAMPFQYIDLHQGNIMKAKNGNLKFVDFEGFKGE